MNNEGIKVGLDMTQLCRSVLLKQKLKPEYLEQLDLDKLFGICKYYCLSAMVCMALEYNGITPGSKWIEAKAKAIRKNMLLDTERTHITAFLEKEHIWYDAVLKDFYPKAGMWQMSDNDILFDESK